MYDVTLSGSLPVRIDTEDWLDAELPALGAGNWPPEIGIATTDGLPGYRIPGNSKFDLTN
ncbi:MAG: hypothetical protein HYZ38_13685 [Mycobacterium sp.]|nr:hypothetical protein [Mycobacterium sp.]